MKIHTFRTHRWLMVPAAGLGIIALHGLLVAVCGIGVGAVVVSKPTPSGPPPAVIIQKLPDGCIQPQAAVDSKGIVHLVYFKGKPGAGDLYYVHFPVNQGISSASSPIRVNSKPDTAIAAGTIRTEQISIGQGDKLHVVW